jgi:uncharacterized protein YjiS (DUF1127 family)
MLIGLFNSLAEKYRSWRRREQAFYELFSLDDRSLADLGISRSDIPYVVKKIPLTVRPLERNQPRVEDRRRAA